MEGVSLPRVHVLLFTPEPAGSVVPTGAVGERGLLYKAGVSLTCAQGSTNLLCCLELCAPLTGMQIDTSQAPLEAENSFSTETLSITCQGLRRECKRLHVKSMPKTLKKNSFITCYMKRTSAVLSAKRPQKILTLDPYPRPRDVLPVETD